MFKITSRGVLWSVVGLVLIAAPVFFAAQKGRTDLLFVGPLVVAFLLAISVWWGNATFLITIFTIALILMVVNGDYPWFVAIATLVMCVLITFTGVMIRNSFYTPREPVEPPKPDNAP
jgi:hypothetical protein